MTPTNQPPSMEERMTRVETTLEHLATKEEIADLKVFIMRWVTATIITSVAATATVAITISRLIG